MQPIILPGLGLRLGLFDFLSLVTWTRSISAGRNEQLTHERV